MADGPVLALQDAVVLALLADADVAALVSGRVFVEPQDDVVFPYIHLGRQDASADRIGCYTDDSIIFSVECHSRPVSARVEALQIAHAVRMALDDAELALDGYTLDWCDYLTHAVSRSSAGDTYTATVAFEAAVAVAT
ncbi:DUF3168 domain-containing protein [Salipiger sp. H15]|uniref:DUF3168 domain-containing protein n=1 Tax=Alloyangia sp. H15 TaxID=3029062 RepID=A0AAU8AP20_9RHOB